MKVTVNNFNEDIVKRMIKKIIELVEQKENVKIDYKIVAKQ